MDLMPRRDVPEERDDAAHNSEQTTGAAPQQATRIPDPEVEPQVGRRRFTAQYKLKILREAEQSGKGEVAALLRRESLYSSHLASWRRQRERGELQGLKPKKRGPKPRRDPAGEEIKRLRLKNARLERELEKARTIIDFQKKLSQLLGVPLNDPANDESDS